jgi:hypothetical protein
VCECVCEYVCAWVCTCVSECLRLFKPRVLFDCVPEEVKGEMLADMYLPTLQAYDDGFLTAGLR